MLVLPENSIWVAVSAGKRSPAGNGVESFGWDSVGIVLLFVPRTFTVGRMSPLLDRYGDVMVAEFAEVTLAF